MGSPVSIEVILLQELLGASWNITQESLEVLLDATLLCPRLGGMVRTNGPRAAELPTVVGLPISLLHMFFCPPVLPLCCPPRIWLGISRQARRRGFWTRGQEPLGPARWG